MGHLPQTINLPLAQRVEALNTGGLVASPFTGAVSVAVLLFTAATAITPAGSTAFISAVNDANLGTVVTINEPGVYEAELFVAQVASVDVVLGISQDVVVGGLTAVPAFATVGMLDVQRLVTIAGQTSTARGITSRIIVSPEQADAGSLVRFHATLQAGGAPAVALVAASAYFRITRLNQAHV